LQFGHYFLSALGIPRSALPMSPIQIGFLIFTFAGPILLWILSRHLDSARFASGICWVFALALIGAWATSPPIFHSPCTSATGRSR
jgi:hypothetical protein